jgi:hypothetical protein
MGLLDKLQGQGSVLTDLDGKTPAGFAPTAGQSKLHDEYSINGNPRVRTTPVPSTLDWDGKTPTIIGKFPYLDNLPE